MRRIEKGDEPRELGAWRATNPGVLDWRALDGDVKAAVQATLCEEQRGLCAYCQSRIKPDGAAMRIEHWNARSAESGETFTWTNLLGCCRGKSGASAGAGAARSRPSAGSRQAEWTPSLRPDHCDVARGNAPLRLHPAAFPGDIGALFRTLANGCIASDDPRAREDIATLNLNNWRLCDNRKAALDALRARLPPLGHVSVAYFERLLRDLEPPDDGSSLPPFAEVLRQQLRKWIRQHTGQ